MALATSAIMLVNTNPRQDQSPELRRGVDLISTYLTQRLAVTGHLPTVVICDHSIAAELAARPGALSDVASSVIVDMPCPRVEAKYGAGGQVVSIRNVVYADSTATITAYTQLDPENVQTELATVRIDQNSPMLLRITLLDFGGEMPSPRDWR